MRAITKGPEPDSLAAHRNEPYSSYDNYAAEAKEDLRRVLVSEQRGLCCYCMGRIRPERTWVRLFCVGGPEGSRRGCERHGKSYLTRRRRGEEGDGGGSLTGGAIPSA